ncbi:MAG: retroviral-like aspartic protease family protein [Oscillospiraceae bacterium]|nr:retroviral-like aspartic protease family protein [Oscillospiraceae bacterium]
MIKLGVSLLDGVMWVKPKLWNYNFNRLSNCNLLFDTGATMTSIDTSVAKRAGVSLKDAPTVKVGGIGGKKDARIVTVKEFWLGEVNLGAVSVHVIDFDEDCSASGAGVLGMNIIRNFITTIDLDQSVDNSEGVISMKPLFEFCDTDRLESFNPAQSRFGLWKLTQHK